MISNDQLNSCDGGLELTVACVRSSQLMMCVWVCVREREKRESLTSVADSLLRVSVTCRQHCFEFRSVKHTFARAKSVWGFAAVSEVETRKPFTAL
jgi:hypothetical protein